MVSAARNGITLVAVALLAASGVATIMVTAAVLLTQSAWAPLEDYVVAVVFIGLPFALPFGLLAGLGASVLLARQREMRSMHTWVRGCAIRGGLLGALCGPVTPLVYWSPRTVEAIAAALVGFSVAGCIGGAIAGAVVGMWCYRWQSTPEGSSSTGQAA